MKIFQCIHKYSPHIPLFETKYGVTDDTDFETLRRLIIEDGYASSYVLLPALKRKSDVFFTIWDYDRLQLRWAAENGLRTSDLDEIKLAQILAYQPDVFYNMSAVYDRGFVDRLGALRPKMKCVYWNAIIEREPRKIDNYDGQISLHRPFVQYWQERGLAATELQPGIPDNWYSASGTNRPIDVLFYGQYAKGLHDSRNIVVDSLLNHREKTSRDIRCHVQYAVRRVVLRVPKVRWLRLRSPFISFPSQLVRRKALGPLYGRDLYGAIAASKIVVNGYGNFNHDYKSNMRLFEAIGLGSFLISEEGNYPDGFEPGVDFYTYRNANQMVEQIERVLCDWPAHAEIARRTQIKISEMYSKERQWSDFQKFVSAL